MFEDIFTETVMLRVPIGNFVDGQPECSESQENALITDFTRRDIDIYGNVKSGKIFLFNSVAVPVPGSQIVYQGKIYDLKDIKTCRDLDGNVECYRCVVV
jgi:hypothetical protein